MENYRKCIQTQLDIVTLETLRQFICSLISNPVIRENLLYQDRFCPNTINRNRSRPGSVRIWFQWFRPNIIKRTKTWFYQDKDSSMGFRTNEINKRYPIQLYCLRKPNLIYKKSVNSYFCLRRSPGYRFKSPLNVYFTTQYYVD